LRFIQHISGEVVCFRHPLTCMFKAFGSLTHFIRAVLHILNLSVGLFGKQAKVSVVPWCDWQLFQSVV
jgi:hypothetical protein